VIPTTAETSGLQASRELVSRFRLDLELPRKLEAAEPPEARGLARDQVRMLVSRYKTDTITHSRFRQLPEFIDPGDVLVINTSGTRKSAVDVCRPDFVRLKVHLSTQLAPHIWVLELRLVEGDATKPYYDAATGDVLHLRGGAIVRLLSPRHVPLISPNRHSAGKTRLWKVNLKAPLPIGAYLDTYAKPIRYEYVKKDWPISYYQTVYATQTGSAEMPSAGRPFTPELITRLVAHGVIFAPLVLHTGVASLEAGEKPYEEYYNVPEETAYQINQAKSRGKRIIAVGTTSVRAIETVTGPYGKVHPGEGWTDLMIYPESGMRVVNSLITGFHEPKATHLAMLEALAGKQHLQLAYNEALSKKYLWHEFGDIHFLLA
jgi:S-adenosylmethionine:tRNA ribosyltransferase-isomerase